MLSKSFDCKKSLNTIFSSLYSVTNTQVLAHILLLLFELLFELYELLLFEILLLVLLVKLNGLVITCQLKPSKPSKPSNLKLIFLSPDETFAS